MCVRVCTPRPIPFSQQVDLLDDLLERAARADEPPELNYIRKHALKLEAAGVERGSARLFSNPAGDYGSLVNERVGNGDWEEEAELGATWQSRNAFSFGRGAEKGVNRAAVLEELLATTDRIVQEIDSVEYGLTDIQVGDIVASGIHTGVYFLALFGLGRPCVYERRG